MRYMLDSDICVYIIKQRPESVLSKLRENMADGIAISAVTLAELECGVQKSASPEKNTLALNQVLSILSILPFDDMAAYEYGKVRADLERKGTPIGPLDTQIASHAKVLGMTIVTNNVREFGRVEGLAIENWADLADQQENTKDSISGD